MKAMVQLGIPTEPALLQALGRLAVAHGNLEMVQIMCLKTLNGLAPDEALEQLRGKRAADIRDRIQKIVAERIGPGEKAAAKELKELLLDARCASRRRNEYLHRFWACRGADAWVTSPDESLWEPLPAVEVIEDLTRFILATTARLNAERFDGGLLFSLATPAPGQEQKR